MEIHVTNKKPTTTEAYHSPNRESDTNINILLSNTMSTNTNGNKLSKQQEYFKDSRVVDDIGKLKVVYHGTPNEDFTVFDADLIGETTDEGEYGREFYLQIMQNVSCN